MNSVTINELHVTISKNFMKQFYKFERVVPTSELSHGFVVEFPLFFQPTDRTTKVF